MNLDELYIAYQKDPTLTDEFYETLLNYCTALLKNRYGATWQNYEDSVQEVALKVLEAKEGSVYKGYNNATFRTWVKAVLFNECKDLQDMDIAEHSIELMPAREALSLDDKIDLEQRIKALTPKQKEVILLQLEGYTEEEIAEKLNIHIQTVKYRVANAIKTMKNL